MSENPAQDKGVWFPFEGFLRMRTNYTVALELDELILKPNVTQSEIKTFIESIIEGIKKNERKI